MAMTVVVTGKIYNGKTFDWKDTKKEERLMFRGRLNYRDRTNGEWYFVDAVCWKDFGNENGLVGFLEEHFSADSDNAPSEKGGQAIELIGYLRPVKRTRTEKVPKQFRVGGKVKTIDVDVEVEYETFEFVIETADFPPTNEKFTGSKGKSKSNDVVDVDFDEEDEDIEIELVDDEEDEAVEEVEEPKEKPLTPAEKRKLAADAKKKKEAASKKTKADDAEFFNN